MTWLITTQGGLTALVGRTHYRIRRVNGFRRGAPPLWWLYVGGSRYTPTGRFEDAVSFATIDKARHYAEALVDGRTS
jgi:hypothetical protein